MRYVREVKPEVNFFTSPDFAGLRQTLDGEMERLRAQKQGVKHKRAEPITIDEENIMGEKGVLGNGNPQTLIDTLIYLIGIHFALRSGDEHRSLTFSQIEIVTPAINGKSSYLIYTENVSKTNSGGLSHRKVEPKQVIHHANGDNPSRCLVAIFKTYISHCPVERKSDALYLTPLKKPKIPLVHNTLSRTVRRLCDSAGIDGYKTNHSL